MASEYKFKSDQELLQLLPGTPGKTVFSDEEDGLAGAPLGRGFGEPRNGKGLHSPEDIE